MPGMTGLEVCRRLQADPRLAKIPVIFITAMTKEEDEVKAFEVGGVDYITKPFRSIVVRARIKTHLELKSHRDTLEKLASLDGLTGIKNRRSFDSDLATAWSAACRVQQPLSLALIDVDHFKQYNDHYGHVRGDACLIAIAKALKSLTKRATDVVARFGGEEFAVLLPYTKHEDALDLGRKMLTSVRSLEISHAPSPTADQVTVSLGVFTCIPGRKEPATTLIAAADRLLYEAKEKGRNCLVGGFGS